MPVIGTPRTFHKKFKFVIEIDNVAHAGFQKCSALEMEIGEVKHREGGVLTAQKDAGLVEVPDITLERGASSSDSDLYDWAKLVADMAAEKGSVDADYKRTLDIVQLDRDGTELRRWTCYEVWPKKLTVGEWDNDADENVIESVVLSVRYWDKTLG